MSKVIKKDKVLISNYPVYDYETKTKDCINNAVIIFLTTSGFSYQKQFYSNTTY